MRYLHLIPILLSLGCSDPKPLHGVVEPKAGETLKRILGPMPGFGSFDTYSDALLAACPLILNQPNAVAGKPSDPNFRLYWPKSREYCAWIYRTPIEANGRKIPLGIVAFFSNSLEGTCDGFHQYIPATNELLKWTPESTGRWRSEVVGEVVWNDGNYEIKRR
ncbi:hypothetical protein [Archangium sp.]|uniref:hypothetical protein n=1 Tax=Archangium sp. TaxID=1872627 RepID=UPI002D314F7A|nr:hypothetical protein [Archangium sp.]HYO57887.1 hypothetical protein [Archangium sp.]